MPRKGYPYSDHDGAKLRVILFGATGMVGRGVLLECLGDPNVAHVLSVGRRTTGEQHEKLTEMFHDDFADYSTINDALAGFDACFFCLGVSSVGMSEAEYRHITYDFTLAAAQTLAVLNPRLVFCYVSGEGADNSETSRLMWARVRGKTEHDLLKLPLAGAYVFRLGYVQAMKGATPQVPWIRLGYRLLGPLYPLLKRLLPNHVTTTEHIGRAMIRTVQHGHPTSILRSREINALAAM